jgi:NAD(P)-dependent dehydrogenase (short-subunit alcohol dehydrogenase family)
MTRPSALIAGGSTGIGFAIATVLVEDGWDVTIAARDEAKLAAATEALRTGAEHRARRRSQLRGRGPGARGR